MESTESIFRHAAFLKDRLYAYGFAATDDGFFFKSPIMGGDFLLFLTIGRAGEIVTEVRECESGEVYTLFAVKEARGAFIDAMRAEVEAILYDVREKCCFTDVFQSAQAKMAIAYVEKTYGDPPEFLWEKSTDYAVFRRAENKKWYGVLITLKKARLQMEGEGEIEILDLHARPDEIEALPQDGSFLAGYHMNKRHWYAIPLDGRLSDDEICRRIDASYLLATKK